MNVLTNVVVVALAVVVVDCVSVVVVVVVAVVVCAGVSAGAVPGTRSVSATTIMHAATTVLAKSGFLKILQSMC